MKDMKVLLVQNIHRAFSEAHRCGKIPLRRWVPKKCSNGGLWHPSKVISNSESGEHEEEIVNDEDKDKRVQIDALKELD